MTLYYYQTKVGNIRECVQAPSQIGPLTHISIFIYRALIHRNITRAQISDVSMLSKSAVLTSQL